MRSRSARHVLVRDRVPSCSDRDGMNGTVQDATAVMNFDTTNDAGGVTYERAQTLASGGIPVKVVPLSEGYLLAQGQAAGDNIFRPNVRTQFKTYWHETFD